MKLEKLEATASKDRVKLLFEDGTALRVPVSVVADLTLYKGMELRQEELERIEQAAGKASAKLRAVRIVAASGVSKRELGRRLVQKGEKPQDAQDAVAWLEQLQLLDDAQAAKRIAEKGAAKGYGSARILQMLYQKGIDRQTAQQALQDLPSPDAAIDRYLQQHLSSPEPEAKELKKITDALLRRGHRWEDIRAGLRRHRLSVEEESI